MPHDRATKKQDGTPDTARAERELTQAFLSQADLAWDNAYREQGVLIEEGAIQFLGNLRDTAQPIAMADGSTFMPFTVSEGDRENRLGFANVVNTEDGFNFYRDNAATDAGSDLIGMREGVNIHPEFKDGLQQGYYDTDIAKAKENAQFWENPVSNTVDMMLGGLNYLIFPEEGMKAKIESDTNTNALYRLEILEGDARGAGYISGAGWSTSNDEFNQLVFGTLAGGILARNLPDTHGPNGTTPQHSANSAHVDVIPEGRYSLLIDQPNANTYRSTDGRLRADENHPQPTGSLRDVTRNPPDSPSVANAGNEYWISVNDKWIKVGDSDNSNLPGRTVDNRQADVEFYNQSERAGVGLAPPEQRGKKGALSEGVREFFRILNESSGSE